LIFDSEPKRFSGADQVLLPNKFIKILWPDPARKRFHSISFNLAQ